MPAAQAAQLRGRGLPSLTDTAEPEGRAWRLKLGAMHLSFPAVARWLPG